ncbi:hypothetical protein DFH06DRAFT_1169409 [Mycena polygramma]|nr:hypothetical protein DFH06DRAFT_1169409 [Mycena polygramma]
MAFIPQELVDSIIAELDDLDSLKTCSLAGPMFRDPSQRRLLRCITLTGWPHNDLRNGNCAAARTLFDQSPHLAAYVQDLKILLNPGPDLDHLQDILLILKNVRRCIVDGHGQQFRWNNLNPGLAAAFVKFFSRQALQDLRLCRVVITPSASFIWAVPSLSSYITGATKLNPDLSGTPSTLRDLALHFGSQDLCALLASPDFRSHIAGLRRLSILPRFDDSMALITAAAGTLQHIHFDCDVPTMAMHMPLPELPALRILEFRISFDTQTLDPLLITLSCILESSNSPTFADVVLTFPVWNYRLLQSAARSRYMTVLDAAFVAHPAVPRMRWRASFAEPSNIDCFTDLVKLGLPALDARGKLVVEEYQMNHEAWPPSPTQIETC